MGVYGTPEHLPSENQEPQYQYGQYPYPPTKRRRKKWPIVIAVIVGLFVLINCFGAYLNSHGYGQTDSAIQANIPDAPKMVSSLPSSSLPAASAFISKATYDKLKTGMTYEEVVKLFGLSGKQIYESGEKGSGNFVVSYLWENESGPQQIQIDFLENKLWQKTEYYLE